MKKITQLSMLPALLAFSGVVLAVPPTGFSYDDYTADAGAITASCPAGYTCTNLDATGNGIVQRRVTDGVNTYFHTIILEEGTTASDLAGVEALAFRAESFVGAEDGGGDMSSRNILQGFVLGDTVDNFTAEAEITTGALSAGQTTNLEQTNLLGGANRFVNFSGVGASNQLTMQIDAVQPNNEGNITVRKASAVGAGELELTDADVGIEALAYAAGNRLSVVWLEQAASGIGSQFDRILGMQRYTNETAGTSIEYINNDGAGNFVATNTGSNNPVDGIGPWNWDAALFGTAPNPYLVNGAGTGIAQPVTTFP